MAFHLQLHLWKWARIFDLETKSIHTPGSPNPKYESDNYILCIIPLVVSQCSFNPLIIEMKRNKYKYQQAFRK